MPADQVKALQYTFTNAFHLAFLVCAAIAAIGVLTSLVRGKEREKGGIRGEAMSIIKRRKE